MNRRQFVTVTALGAGSALLARGSELGECALLGKLRSEDGAAPVPGAKWHVAEAAGDGMEFRFPKGTLAKAKCLTSDMLLDGRELAVFAMVLREGDNGRAFRFSFGALNQCSFRVRVDLGLVDQSRWMVDREGAFLKPICGGDRVDLQPSRPADVDGVAERSESGALVHDRIARRCRDAAATREAGAPQGPIAGRIRAERDSRLAREDAKRGGTEDAPARSVRERFQTIVAGNVFALGRFAGEEAGRGHRLLPHPKRRPPLVAGGSRRIRVLVGGSRLRPRGYRCARGWDRDGAEVDAVGTGVRGRAPRRRTRRRGNESSELSGGEHDSRVRPRDGWRDKWAQTVLAEMKRLRFNTVGNWSEFEPFAKARFPYVRPINFRGHALGDGLPRFPGCVPRGLRTGRRRLRGPIAKHAQRPGAHRLLPDERADVGILLRASRRRRACTTPRLARRATNWRGFSGANTMATRLSPLPGRPRPRSRRSARGKWKGVLPNEAMADLREFSGVMVERYFQALSKACRQVDSKHLNLGMRWQGIPKDWAVPGMKSFDVFSLNCYQDKLPRDTAEKIASLLKMPVLVGEWHFGALDAGLPASGIGHLKNQAERAKAYRVYLEDAAADPYCVGVHWFTLYDQSAIGRFDGENYNIGFLDVCNRAYDELGRGAIASHERMYQVAGGEAKPFAEGLDYLPKLFL